MLQLHPTAIARQEGKWLNPHQVHYFHTYCCSLSPSNLQQVLCCLIYSPCTRGTFRSILEMCTSTFCEPLPGDTSVDVQDPQKAVCTCSSSSRRFTTRVCNLEATEWRRNRPSTLLDSSLSEATPE